MINIQIINGVPNSQCLQMIQLQQRNYPHCAALFSDNLMNFSG